MSGFKMIYPESQSSVAATSENSEYPASNLLDSKTRKVWKATAAPATITLTTTGNDDCVMLDNIDADSAVVTVKDSLGATVGSPTTYYLGSGGSRVYTRLWHEFTAQVAGHNIEIALAKSSGIISAGVIRSGTMFDLLKNPVEPNIDRDDQNIIKDLSNGAPDIHYRYSPRTYAPSFTCVSAAKIEALMAIYDANGALPLAMLIADGGDDQEHCIFGYMRKPPSGVRNRINLSNLILDIKEAI